MSVQTTADERIDEAKTHIKQAYKCITDALDKNTWGSSDYRESYIDIMEESLANLRKIARKL